jgi:hypothetical protein
MKTAQFITRPQQSYGYTQYYAPTQTSSGIDINQIMNLMMMMMVMVMMMGMMKPMMSVGKD